MAEIAAFKGIRYNETEVGSLDKVTSPPYDIISPEDRAYYHRLHPNNFVRLILGEEFESDNESDNRFTRAKAYLDQWLRDGVLIQDAEPSIYIYEQQFERDGKRVVRGITCAVKIHDYADKVILPHENTLAKPKSQLGQLIREAKANLDCVYGLYADEHGALDDVMARAMGSPSVADVHDKDGVRHILWALSDASDVAVIVDYMKDKPIAIADGHHRYETALGYRDEMREKSGGSGELPSDYTLMTIANVYQEDMTIFPTHRVLANIPAELLDSLDRMLSNLFESAPSSRGSILSDMARLGAIGVYRKGEARTLKLKAAPGSLLSGSEASRKLELNVLHKLILEPALGIDDEKLRNQTHIIYTRSADEAMDLVDSGERQIAFLLNHIAVKSVLDVASAGEKMPQKATYFYPKLLSGLMLRLLATEAK
ncbi:MAG: DUF1015 domain-containing protein [Armatimonadetes bacterium]|nr:DUF1015 domain-containing protein [Armatimonadota bacterium]